MTRPIVFLTDYGLSDEFVGICHGVIARISPGSTVIDLTHAVPRQDVMSGALTLGRATGYMPIDAVYVAVVDPSVGSDRRSIAAGASPLPAMNSFAAVTRCTASGPAWSPSIAAGAESVITAAIPSPASVATAREAVPPMLAPTRATVRTPFARR